jgi:hypothetical protein
MIIIALLAAMPINASESTGLPAAIASSAGNASPDTGGTGSDFWTNSSKDLNSLTHVAPGQDQQGSASQKISVLIDYNSPIKGIVGLTIDADVSGYKTACAAWKVISNAAESKTCNGDADCCRSIGMKSNWSEWNTALYLTRGISGVEESNLVTVQVLASNSGSFSVPSAIHNSDVQRIAVIIPDANSTGEVSVQVISGAQQLEGVYIQLPDENAAVEEKDVSIDAGPLAQGIAQIGSPVSWYQQIRVKNKGLEELNYSFSLWDSGRAIGIDFLNDVIDFRMSFGGQIISEASVAVIHLMPGEEKLLEMTYLTPPVMMDKTCFDISIADLLPQDAMVTEQDIALDTPVKTVCNIRIYHNTVTHYRNIQVNLDDIDPSFVESIYYVEGARFLDMKDGAIDVPSAED